MAEADKTLVCSECGTEFSFTAGEQEFFRQKGFTHVPKRCRRCRSGSRGENAPPRGTAGRKAPSHLEYAGSPPPQRARAAPRAADGPHEVTCSHCGALTRLPFRPDGVRPVYCRSCFQERRRATSHKG